MVDIKSIILDTPTEKLENLLSPFIQEQFPGFIRSDYPKLILFIKAYYEWLETQNNPGYVLSKLDSVGDVDKNLEEFYSHFKNTYLESFPDVLATNISGNKPNKKTLLKKIREFYGNKGTESAYAFLFRILYDSDLEIYYPKADILKVSDGNWIEPRSIKTSTSNGTALFDVKNGEIAQYEDTTLVASAFIEDVVQYVFNGVSITEFFIRDIVGDFQPGKSVVVRRGSTQYYETPYSVLGEFFIELPGSGYQIGDLVTVQDSNGVGFSARIEQTGLAGTIKKIAISNSGINYPTSLVANIISERGQRNAKVILLSSAVTNYPGYFSGNRGKVSSNKYIQDGNYYQDFSYVLKSEVSFDQYFDVLKTIIHPSGTRMFGSVLVKKELQNQSSSSSQGTFIETPLIGQYTPYTFNTFKNLRNNGNENAGYWLGATGDLYPFGYNPYIGSTSEVGPNGKTTANGTVFVYSQLGYTWCYVPEDGITSHNPIGAALGSTSAWYLNRESNLDPADINGLVLWLKPENIGVCGSVVNGASADVWTDASPQANHALPPTWDRWNDVAHITHTATTSTEWLRQVYDNTNPVTKIAFVFNGLCGGFTKGRLCMVGLNTASVVTAAGYSPGNWVYSRGPYESDPTAPRRVYYITYDDGTQVSEISPTLDGYDNSVFEMEYVEPNLIWRKDGVVKRRKFVGYGQTFYADSTFYMHSNDTSRTGTSVTITELSYNGNPVTPTFTVSAGMDARIYAGVTVDKLRPTLQTAGYGGATGVSFNGGVVYSPLSTYQGNTLGSLIGMGTTYGSTTTAEKILTGQHLYLSKPITLSGEMDVFVVMSSRSDSPNNGMGLVSLSDRLSVHSPKAVKNDAVFFNRTYNTNDRTAANQNSSFYSVSPRGNLLYPTTSGLVGFRPGAANDTAQKTTISYDPHVSGVCMGIVIGEWTRDSSNRIQTYLNGDASINRSRSTGIRVVSSVPPSSEAFRISAGGFLDYDSKTDSSITNIKKDSAANLMNAIAGDWVEPVDFSTSGALQPVGFGRNGGVINGAATENGLTLSSDPWTNSSVVWYGRPDVSNSTAFPGGVTTGAGNADGGFVAASVSADKAKTYRFSLWMNRKRFGTGLPNSSNSANGSFYLGLVAYNASGTEVPVVNMSTGVSQTNPYFYSSAPKNLSAPEYPEDTWVLVVGHVHPEGTAAPGANHPDSGLYTRTAGSGSKLRTTGDYIWTSNTVKTSLRSYLYYCKDGTPLQYFLNPRIEVVDGTEPTIQELLDNGPAQWNDISPPGNNALLVNKPVYRSDSGGYLEFDGVHDQAVAQSSMTVGKNSTWEAWINRTASINNYNMFMGADTPYFAFVGSDSGTNHISVVSSIGSQLRTAKSIDVTNPNGKWWHSVATFSYDEANNTTTVQVFLNGILENKFVFNGQYDETSTKFTIGDGRPNNKWYPFKGRVARVAVYNRALREEEIRQNFNSLRSRFGV